MNSFMVRALTPFSGLYGAAARTRRMLYARGALRVHKVGRPVISVGNITVGGTGKTPLVVRIVQALSAGNRRVCILTRGYGRRDKRSRVIVSDGNKILADAERAGDEAFLLAEKLEGRVAVISDADRVAAAFWAIENLKSEVFILDDGFQNLRIERNLNLVTIDATNPWGNGKLLPAGILREPLSALSRADCLVITRTDEAQQLDPLEGQLRRLNQSAIVFHSRMISTGLRPVGRVHAAFQESEVKQCVVAAFCGIGNPQSFFSLARKCGYRLCHTETFRDHHRYRQTDIDQIVRQAVAKGAQALLTSSKDEVKLRSIKFDLPCYAVDIEIDIEPGAAFDELINKAIV
jgi:tetraacyldisaccharide 4'-kinase